MTAKYFQSDINIKKDESSNRHIFVRFSSQEDIDEFIKQTGIKINTKIKKYKFSSKPRLQHFFKNKV